VQVHFRSPKLSIILLPEERSPLLKEEKTKFGTVKGSLKMGTTAELCFVENEDELHGYYYIKVLIYMFFSDTRQPTQAPS